MRRTQSRDPTQGRLGALGGAAPAAARGGARPAPACARRGRDGRGAAEGGQEVHGLRLGLGKGRGPWAANAARSQLSAGAGRGASSQKPWVSASAIRGRSELRLLLFEPPSLLAWSLGTQPRRWFSLPGNCARSSFAWQIFISHSYLFPVTPQALPISGPVFYSQKNERVGWLHTCDGNSALRNRGSKSENNLGGAPKSNGVLCRLYISINPGKMKPKRRNSKVFYRKHRCLSR